MGVREKQQDLSAPSEPTTGDFLDNKTRKVTEMGGSENCLGTNLSELGVSVLGVEKQDEIDLIVYQEGIWIPRK